MILTVDIGNSSAKVELWRRGAQSLPEREGVIRDGLTCGALEEFIGTEHVEAVAWCSVAASLPPEDLFAGAGRVLHVTPQTPMPMRLAYGTPQTLGADRAVAAVGALSLYPEAPELLVVDMGTAVTYDRVSDATFIGGNIAPGLKMRLDALHNGTGRLPAVSPTQADINIANRNPFGTDTRSAIFNGCSLGIVAEINYYASLIPGDKIVVLTGKDSLTVEKCGGLNADTVAVCANLVGLGLKTILEYNETL